MAYKIVEAEVRNEKGIHARPSALLVRSCLKHDKKYTITARKISPEISDEIDARDVMGWMTLEAYQGSRIKVKIEYDPKNNEKNSYVDKLTAELVKLIDSDLDEIVERYARTQSNFRIRIIHFLMNYLPHFLRRGK